MNSKQCCLFSSGDHSGAGSGTGRWGAETRQLFVHAMWTQSPREAAECRQRRDAQVTPPVLSLHPLMVAKPHKTDGLFLCLVYFHFSFITFHNLTTLNGYRHCVCCIFIHLIVNICYCFICVFYFCHVH